MAKFVKKTRFKIKSYDDFIKLFCDVSIPDILSDILVEDNKYYLIDNESKKIKDEISRSVFSCGLFLGENKQSDFYPSLLLIDLISKYTTKKIIINKKTEWLFLCGRDIFEDSVIDKSTNHGYVLVLNELDEILGIGLFKGNTILNLFDKGDYLRREN
jgi:ribosome biogenesis protein Nip4